MSPSTVVVDIYDGIYELAYKLLQQSKLPIDIVTHGNRKVVSILQTAEDLASATSEAECESRGEEAAAATATAATAELGPAAEQSKFGNHEESNISNAVSNPVSYSGDAMDHDRMSTGPLEEEDFEDPIVTQDGVPPRSLAIYQSNEHLEQAERRSTPSSPSHSTDPTKERKRIEVTPYDNIADVFGVESDLDKFERVVNNTKENVQWTSVWSRYQLLTTPEIDPSQYFRALPNLVQELQVSEVAERFLDLKKRTTLAHFYRTYQVALANPGLFLDLTQWMYTYDTSVPSKGHRINSVVKQHFVKVNVSQSGLGEQKARTQVNNWVRCGRRWAELITRLGCGSLLLVPPNMTTDW